MYFKRVLNLIWEWYFRALKDFRDLTSFQYLVDLGDLGNIQDLGDWGDIKYMRDF